MSNLYQTREFEFRHKIEVIGEVSIRTSSLIINAASDVCQKRVNCYISQTIILILDLNFVFRFFLTILQTWTSGVKQYQLIVRQNRGRLCMNKDKNFFLHP